MGHAELLLRLVSVLFSAATLPSVESQWCIPARRQQSFCESARSAAGVKKRARSTSSNELAVRRRILFRGEEEEYTCMRCKYKCASASHYGCHPESPL